eukprot:6178917-Pleurochrysis_carterae.AAC.1
MERAVFSRNAVKCCTLEENDRAAAGHVVRVLQQLAHEPIRTDGRRPLLSQPTLSQTERRPPSSRLFYATDASRSAPPLQTSVG